MNKTIIILLLFAVGAFTIQFTGTYDIIGTVANLPATLTQGTGNLIADPIGFIKANADILKGVGGALTIATPIFGWIYSKLKTDATNIINQEKSIRLEQGQELLDISQQKDNALAQVQQLTAERDKAIAKAETATAHIKKEAATLQSQVTQLEKEKSELKRLFNYVDEKVIINKKPEPIP